jgi:hypothetical protein
MPYRDHTLLWLVSLHDAFSKSLFATEYILTYLSLVQVINFKNCHSNEKHKKVAGQGNARATLLAPNRKATYKIMTDWEMRFSWTKCLKF